MRGQKTGDSMEFGIGLLIILAALYFLPSLIAKLRGHHSTGAIFVLNLLLGWTFLGWVGALVWSFTGVPRERDS